MTFKALLRKTYRETRGFFFLSRFACLGVEFYLQSSKNHKKALLILQILQVLRQSLAYFYSAKMAYIYGDFKQSLKNLELFLQKNPKHTDATYLKCQILELLEQKDEAFLLLETLLKNSSRVKTWFILASLISSQKDLEKLQRLYKQNINNFKRFTQKLDEILRHFTRAALNGGDFLLAKVYLKEALFIFLKRAYKAKEAQKAKFIPKENMRFKDAKEALNDLKSLCEKENITMFLISGTFLGCVREKSILAHDYDIDVGVYFSDLNRLRELFIKNPNFVLKSHTYQGGVQVHHNNGVYIDVFLHYEENGLIYHNGDFMRWKNTPFELIKYEFLGDLYLVPKDYELYLRENYGEDWRVPKNSNEFNSFLDTPNIEILDKQRMVIFLYELLFKSFALKNEKQILEALRFYKEDDFVKEYLSFKERL